MFALCESIIVYTEQRGACQLCEVSFVHRIVKCNVHCGWWRSSCCGGPVCVRVYCMVYFGVMFGLHGVKAGHVESVIFFCVPLTRIRHGLYSIIDV